MRVPNVRETAWSESEKSFRICLTDSLHERDRQTDRRADSRPPYDGIGRAYAIASRGKNRATRKV